MERARSINPSHRRVVLPFLTDTGNYSCTRAAWLQYFANAAAAVSYWKTSGLTLHVRYHIDEKQECKQWAIQSNRPVSCSALKAASMLAPWSVVAVTLEGSILYSENIALAALAIFSEVWHSIPKCRTANIRCFSSKLVSIQNAWASRYDICLNSSVHKSSVTSNESAFWGSVSSIFSFCFNSSAFSLLNSEIVFLSYKISLTSKRPCFAAMLTILCNKEWRPSFSKDLKDWWPRTQYCSCDSFMPCFSASVSLIFLLKREVNCCWMVLVCGRLHVWASRFKWEEPVTFALYRNTCLQILHCTNPLIGCESGLSEFSLPPGGKYWLILRKLLQKFAFPDVGLKSYLPGFFLILLVSSWAFNNRLEFDIQA